MNKINQRNVLQVLREAERIMANARMYADMDEEEFWNTSTISPQEANKRAEYYEEFYNSLLKMSCLNYRDVGEYNFKILSKTYDMSANISDEEWDELKEQIDNLNNYRNKIERRLKNGRK